MEKRERREGFGEEKEGRKKMREVIREMRMDGKDGEGKEGENKK